jgi:hypothetical protein
MNELQNWVQVRIEPIYWIRGRGLVITPILERPRISGFKNFGGEVKVIDMDGNIHIQQGSYVLTYSVMVNLKGIWQLQIIIAGLDHLTRQKIDVFVPENILDRLIVPIKQK